MIGSEYSSSGLEFFGGKGGAVSESVCSQKEIGERKLFSESSNDTLADDIPASRFSVFCS